MTIRLAGDVVDCAVTDVERAADDVRIVRLATADGALFSWRAGQYASFRFRDFEPRDYSIANAPGTGELELHIRRSGAGGLSDYICDGLESGDPVQAQGAFGAAFFREKHDGPLLAIAGGTGLAPMKAIVEAAFGAGLSKDIHLYFGVNRADELYLERHFIGLMRDHANFRFVTVVADENDASGRRRGLVGDAVAADFQLLYGHQCYIAGPPPMVQACRQMLKLKSVPDHDIFGDAFFTEAEMKAKGEPRPDWSNR